MRHQRRRRYRNRRAQRRRWERIKRALDKMAKGMLPAISFPSQRLDAR